MTKSRNGEQGRVFWRAACVGVLVLCAGPVAWASTVDGGFQLGPAWRAAPEGATRGTTSVEHEGGWSALSGAVGAHGGWRARPLNIGGVALDWGLRAALELQNFRSVTRLKFRDVTLESARPETSFGFFLLPRLGVGPFALAVGPGLGVTLDGETVGWWAVGVSARWRRYFIEPRVQTQWVETSIAPNSLRAFLMLGMTFEEFEP